LAVFTNNQKGGFLRNQPPSQVKSLVRDQTSVLAWPKPNGRATVLSGLANYEDGTVDGASISDQDPASGATAK